MDESVLSSVEQSLENKGLETGRFEVGAPDDEVLDCAVENEVPVVIRDQGDFVRLGRKFNHFGIIIDKHIHLRENSDLVAEALNYMAVQISKEDLSNSTWYLSDFYGR